MHLRIGGDSRGWVAPLLLALLMSAAILTWLDKWLYSNEVFNNLSMGLSYQPDDEPLARLRDEALRYCALYASASEAESCRAYQNVITDRFFFAHPLTALVGLQTRDLAQRPNGMARLHWIALEAPLIGAAIALSIWFLLTLALPRADRTAAVVFTLLLLLVGHSHERIFAPVPDLIRNAGGWPAPLTLVAFSALGYLIAWGSQRSERFLSWAEFLSEPRSLKALFWAALALSAASLALPPPFNALLAPLAIGSLAASLAPLVHRSPSLSPLVLAAALGMLFASVTSEPLWVARRMGTAASFATLIYLAVIGLVTLRPRTCLVWALPLMAVFHLPLTALLGLATLIAEAIVGIRTRRISSLLGAAGLSFAIGMAGIVYGIDSAAFAPESARPGDVAALILSWSGLAPALASMVVLGFLALIPLHQGSDPGIALSRAGLLILQGAGAALISAAILQQDGALLNAPGYAMFAKPADYLTPALFPAGILAILLTLWRLLCDDSDSKEMNGRRREALLLLTAVFLLVCVSKLDLKARNSFAPAPVNVWRYAISGKMHRQWCQRLGEARFDDETYYLSKEDPTNDAVIYWSALKARVRSDAKRFRPEDFVVLPAPDRASQCD
ncbi:MAG TPA: hypothetical protein VED46_05590 [Alphaproteobacteria bacterium]|nr:hypothetical protein [Alphaproteobacteria bacterium]